MDPIYNYDVFTCVHVRVYMYDAKIKNLIMSWTYSVEVGSLRLAPIIPYSTLPLLYVLRHISPI